MKNRLILVLLICFVSFHSLKAQYDYKLFFSGGVDLPRDVRGGYDNYWQHYRLNSKLGFYTRIGLNIVHQKHRFQISLSRSRYSYDTKHDIIVKDYRTTNYTVDNLTLGFGYSYHLFKPNWLPEIGIKALVGVGSRDSKIDRSIVYLEEYQKIDFNLIYGTGAYLTWASNQDKKVALQGIIGANYWINFKEYEYYFMLGLSVKISKQKKIAE